MLLEGTTIPEFSTLGKKSANENWEKTVESLSRGLKGRRAEIIRIQIFKILWWFHVWFNRRLSPGPSPSIFLRIPNWSVLNHWYSFRERSIKSGTHWNEIFCATADLPYFNQSWASQEVNRCTQYLHASERCSHTYVIYISDQKC